MVESWKHHAEKRVPKVGYCSLHYNCHGDGRVSIPGRPGIFEQRQLYLVKNLRKAAANIITMKWFSDQLQLALDLLDSKLRMPSFY